MSQDGKTQNFSDASSPQINQFNQYNPKLKGLLMKLDKPKSYGRVKFSKKTKERREGELAYSFHSLSLP